MEMEVFVDVGELPSTAAEIYLTFDSDKLQVADNHSPFALGDFYTGNIVRNEVIGGDEVGFAVVSNASAFPTGQGIVARIRFIARAVGTAKVTFNADQAAWERGRFTFFTRLVAGEPEPRSFKEVINATITVKKTLAKIDEFKFQQFVQENPGRDIPLDDFVDVLEGVDKAQLRWAAQVEEVTGAVRTVEVGIDRLLEVRPFLPKTKNDTAKVTLRVSLEVGNSLAVDSAVISIVNPNTPIIQRLTEVRFRADSEESILLDGFVQDRDHDKAGLRWTIEGIPDELDIEGIDIDEQDLTKGIVRNEHRLTFRVPPDKQPKEETSFELKLTAVDADDNFDSGTLRVIVSPRPTVKLELALPTTVSFFKNEEHQIELDRHVQIDPPEARDQIEWEATGSEHINVSVEDKRLLVFSPEKDWTGMAEEAILAAIFEGKRIDEAAIQVSVSERPPDNVTPFPIAFVRNPVIKSEFKIVAILEDASELTATVEVVSEDEIPSQTISLKKIPSSRNIWLERYSSGARSLDGLKITVNVSGKDANGQDILPSTKTILFSP